MALFELESVPCVPSLTPVVVDPRRSPRAPRAHACSSMVRTCAILLATVVFAAAQMGMDQMPKKPKPAPLNKDVPYIKCQACELMAARALAQVKELVAGAAPKSEKKRRFDHSSDLGGLEAEVEDLVGSVCDSESKAGAWMAEYDIVKRGAALKLESQVGGDTVGGHCRRECRTIEKARALALAPTLSLARAKPNPG